MGVRISLRKLACVFAASDRPVEECKRILSEVENGDLSSLTEFEIEACKVNEKEHG